MPWQREAEFKEVLDKAIKKGSKGAIATVQKIALEDMGQCYKHVCALTERHMRKVKPAQRLNALYIISTICRHSLKKHKLQDKYTGRWGPNIAGLVELMADLPSQQTAQVQKVLTSWGKEKIFSEAILDQCATSVGLTITKSGMLLTPSGDAGYALDGNEINIASPALSAFSEPSAGSVDLAGLDSFPPNTVASANIEPPRVAEASSMPPASNASTGSSRPPDPPKPTAPAELYDPFAAESYDYDPFASDSPPAESPHVLPPLPSMAPTSTTAAPAPTTAAPAATTTALPTVSQAVHIQAAEVGSIANGNMANGQSSSPASGLLPPPAASTLSLPLPPLSGQPPSASRKRKSRWEDAAPAIADETGVNAVAQPPAGPAAAPAAAPAANVDSGPSAAADDAEPKRKSRRSRFSDAPPAAPQAPQPGQGRSPQLPSAPITDSVHSMQPEVPPPPMPAAVEDIVPPKQASARQDGEAQAAAALEAVEQMLQAKRHSEARNMAPSTSRPKQAPMPSHQPPLPRPPRPQPPLPQLPPPQPAFTEGPSWHAGHAGHAGHVMPPFQPMPPVGFPGQLSAFPHLPPMLQQGLQRGLQRPHLGQLAPQHFVQAGLQQHHRPAPPHQLPSMLQHQAAPPPGMPQPQYAPPPPPPQPHWQGHSPMNRQHSFEQVPPRPNIPAASAAAAAPVSRHEPAEADLGHFQVTSVAMDTPTDTGPDPSFRMRRPQTHQVTDAAEDKAAPPAPPAGNNVVPTAPPSPPAATPGAPPPPPPPSPGGITSRSTAPASASPAAEDAVAAAATPVAMTDPAESAGSHGEDRSATPASAPATTSQTAGQLPSDLDAALSREAVDDAHAAAPAGPADESGSPMTGSMGQQDAAELTIPEPPDEEMDMSE